MRLGARGDLLLRAWSTASTPTDLLLGARDLLAVAATMTAATVPEAVALVGSHLGRFHDLNEQSIARLVA
jgi:hypothetical protein